MITSNSLGHFMHCQSPKNPHDTSRALKQAMGTILNAHQEARKKPGLPATRLVPCPAGEASPLAGDPQYGHHSSRVYEGYFHTDHLIPSVFFDGSKPKTLFRDLDLSYIHDATNPEHDELVRGEPTDWYTVKGEIWMRDGAPARAGPRLRGRGPEALLPVAGAEALDTLSHVMVSGPPT